MIYNRIITKGVLLLALILPIVSCQKDEDRLIAQPIEAVQLTGDFGSISLDVNKLDEVVLTFMRTDAKFSADNIALNYQLVFNRPDAKQGDVVRVEIALSKDKEVKLTHRELNDILVSKLKMPIGVVERVQLSVLAQPYTSASVPASAQIESQKVEISVAPIEVLTKSLDYFFVGNMFGQPVWNKDYDGFPLFLDTPDGKLYTYTGNFAVDAEFKLDNENNLGKWSTALGTSEVGKLGAGDNIKDAAAGGYFTLTFDPEALTYEVTPFDATANVEYSAMGLVGSSVGDWNNDVLLKQASYDKHIWRAEGIKLTAGELKIRANKSWDKNWGGKFFPVALSDSGDNIKVSQEQAGTYNVVFNDLTGHYHFRRVAL